jgi:hypothetical protein
VCADASTKFEHLLKRGIAAKKGWKKPTANSQIYGARIWFELLEKQLGLPAG